MHLPRPLPRLGGLALYLLQLGSRRQPDHGLRDGGPRVLANLNRLARAAQTTPPAHDTLDHLPGHVKLAGWERPRARMARRLARLKALGAARLLGRPVLLIDAAGLICFHRRHGPYCLVQRQGGQAFYLHHVLGAKLLGPAGGVAGQRVHRERRRGRHPGPQCRAGQAGPRAGGAASAAAAP